ncbi:T9SS type A sorting domain-containing protein [Antarcticibacterium arcticum]|uniref:T9SS type A sorting domain-containing protein n=1 Tax=Antarcticibacterium arcticum TaxID=2585771 RepID=A0A5B8YHX0_9FLAO|nr:T9SS type A sorting domain-containing protein [Antarcticibacterium arcticum]QED37385.1 T9SS type A sorting domain-containing protein [Antarcticibacterium arcticum]
MCRDENSTSNNFFPVLISGEDANTTWQVERITTNHYVSMQGNQVVVSLLYSSPYNYIAFRVRASNSCGYSDWLEYYVQVTESCGSGDLNNYMVYPNPTSDVLNIKSKKDKDKIDKYLFYEIYSFGAKLMEKGILGDNQVIDVSNYKKGRYILKIKVNDKTETHHIIIE